MKSADSEKNPPGDQLDGLMKAFFRREMPASWPRPPHLPKSQLRSHGDRSAPLSSRWALALALSVFLASLALLPGLRPSENRMGSSAVSTVGEAMAGSRPNLASPSRSRKLRFERQTPPEILPSMNSAREQK